MASLHLFPHLRHFDSTIHRREIVAHTRRQFSSPKASINGGITTAASAAETAKPSRKGRQTKKQQISTVTEETDPDSDPALADYDDGMDFPYDDPPLVCCFGAVQKEFVPVVRVHDNPMHPDIYSQWKMLQWDPPEFGRAPGGPPSNVAISHVRLGGRAAFMGKVGEDDYGEELVLMMNKERVQTRGVKFDEGASTACTRVKIKFEDGKMKAETVKEPPEDSLLASELNLAVLKEARIFHFNSEVLTSPTMQSTLFKAIQWSKKFGGLIFFDLNLPLPLWRSRNETRKLIKKAWDEANIIEVTQQELEFLLDEEYYERRRNYTPQYFAEDFEQTKNRRDYYHYTPEEIKPLWHDELKLLVVTDGTLRLHYYTPEFDGVVVGRKMTGSGDAVVAGIMRKLTTCPEMFEDQDVLERQLGSSRCWDHIAVDNWGS
ncbi:hypothetical protein Bca52824_000221 [Brassica carinata]|uniref:Carbohydrate kinase PfkB domain-containing protein n=1 Tax=Brassica carinata TaxID=52824 RepID=A0A8X7WF75_BRACI|nr:hypothetical protein Bca52824_000221 [Brassica carinata]